ncbi:MAG: cation:proton antiporter [Acidimicrobiales bacterium]
MVYENLTVIACGVIAIALVSGRLGRWAITMPMVFVTLGAVSDMLGIASLALELEGVVIVGEVTLAVILFSDAVRIDLRSLRHTLQLPARLLGIGLPLTIALGALIISTLLPALSFWEACLVAAILAPTDAALGQAVVEEKAVPVRIRQGLNVESGLNDGMVVPFFTLFLALSEGDSDRGIGYWVGFVANQVVIGTAIGIAVGGAGGWLLTRAMRRGWVEGIYAQLATLAVGLAAFGGSVAVGSNGFIAAFVAGLTFGGACGGTLAEKLDEYTEDSGRLLAMIAFFIFGNLFVLDAIADISVRIVVSAIALLTIGRMLPVATALLGSKSAWQTTIFMGWFGPRGLASILFGLLLLEERLDNAAELFTIIAITVLLSVFAHGLTSNRGAAAYGRWFASMDEEHPGVMPESEVVPEPRPRWSNQ